MHEEPVDDPQVSARFRDVAGRVLDAMLAARPEHATDLGDHRFDDRLTDYSPDEVAEQAAVLADALTALDDVDDASLVPSDRIDLEILRTQVTGTLWELTELRSYERNPLVHLPGDALYPLIARSTGHPAERLRALAARLALVPARLETAREVLTDMPKVHVETAIVQARGTVAMLTSELGHLLAAEPGMAGRVEPARDAALGALAGHIRWLERQLPVSDGDPRLGEQAFAAQLWYTLDTETVPDVLLTRAESDLQAIEEEIAELASDIAGAPPAPGQVREVLDRMAAQAAVTDDTILPMCRDALALLTQRCRDLDLVTIPDVPVELIVMPPSRRGVAVAYCDAPGPLEPAGAGGRPLPTFFAVSPAPPEWDASRVESFYREYNGHMVRNLTVHEAMPGHVLQLWHAAQYRPAGRATRVRAAARSGPMVEGWAVYAEELVAAAGLGLTPADDAALRLQQLKMQLRSTINCILDIRVHAHGMTRDEAITLMTQRGHQEDGEAAGKWRRALLTSSQLSTYYVGYREIAAIARETQEAHPTWTPRQLHDAMLAHGSPPPRHLRPLLGLS
jgi:uncharacterized protein (DUF885 family)